MLVMTGGPAAAWSAIPAGHSGPACDVLCRPSAQSYAKKFGALVGRCIEPRRWEGHGLVTGRPPAMGDRRGGPGCAGCRGRRGLALRAALHRGSAAGPVLPEGPRCTRTRPGLPASSRGRPQCGQQPGDAGNSRALRSRCYRDRRDLCARPARGRPRPAVAWLARQLFRGPTLAEAWDRATAADIVKLDLKQTDRGFLDDLVAFLARRARSRRAMISSGD